MKLFTCMSCNKKGEGETSFTIRSRCFEKPITFNLSNDDDKFQMIHELIWTLIGDNEEQKQKLKRNLSKTKENKVIATEI